MNAGPRGDQLVEALDQAAAAGHDDAVGGNIRHQLGRRALKHLVDRFHNAFDRFFEGVHHLGGGDGDQLGKTGEQAAALDFHGSLLLGREHAADPDLHLLCRALADEQVVLLAHILDDRFIELVAGDLDGRRLDHAGKRDHGDIGRTAADVDDQVSVRLGNVDAGADGGGNRLLNEVHAARTGLNAGVDDGALLHLGDAGRNADDDARLEELEPYDLVNKFLDHALGDFIVGNDAFAQRTDRNDVARRATEHRLRFRADLQKLAAVFFDRNDARLVEDDTLVLYIDQNRRGTEVDTDIFCECTHSSLPLLLFLKTATGSAPYFPNIFVL